MTVIGCVQLLKCRKCSNKQQRKLFRRHWTPLAVTQADTMRQGSFELLIMGEGDVPYQEHILDGKPCVQAEPGHEYHVKINIYRNQTGQFPAKYLRFGLYVDGYDVQYWKRIDLSNEKLLPTDPLEPVCSKFWGFKKNVNDLRSFVFSVPSTNADSTMLNSYHTSLGVVKLEVYEAEVSTGVYANQDGYFEAPSQQEIGESAKFWKQASVTTSAGKKVVSEKEKFAPLPRWSNKSSVPMTVLNVQYHTGAMIEFLKEFQHKLHDGASNKSNYGEFSGSSTSSSSSGSSSSGAGSSSGVRYRVNRGASGQDVLDLTADSGDEDSGDAPAAVGSRSISGTDGDSGNRGDLPFQQTQQLTFDVQDGPAAKRARVEGSEEEGPLIREVPIDEDISYVVRKKVVPYLDLSEEVAAGAGRWSTMST